MHQPFIKWEPTQHIFTSHFCFVSGAISVQVYDQWKETNFSTQWCYENYIQVWALQSTYVSLSQVALSLLYPSFLP